MFSRIILYFGAGKYVNIFKVDGIPHLAFIGSDAKFKTALIGSVPKQLLEEDVDALINVRVSPISTPIPTHTHTHTPTFFYFCLHNYSYIIGN